MFDLDVGNQETQKAANKSLWSLRNCNSGDRGSRKTQSVQGREGGRGL